ncbi:MAG: hypothetical protein INQ03_20285 [Candidatus Heimdallarchaeota archaeon]|nr:hypothetical protein [Candidatus Heimdallarchaeota archaeon]
MFDTLLSTILPWAMIVISILAIIFFIYFVIAEDLDELLAFILMGLFIGAAGMFCWLGILLLKADINVEELNTWLLLIGYILTLGLPLIVLISSNADSEFVFIMSPILLGLIGLYLIQYVLPDLLFIPSWDIMLIIQFLVGTVAITVGEAVILVIIVIVANILDSGPSYTPSYTSYTTPETTSIIEPLNESISVDSPSIQEPNDELIEAKEVGFNSVNEWREAQSLGFRTKDQQRYAKVRGFKSKEEMDKIMALGFKTKDNYQIAMEGGFETDNEWKEARKLGFSTKAEWQNSLNNELKSKDEGSEDKLIKVISNMQKIYGNNILIHDIAEEMEQEIPSILTIIKKLISSERINAKLNTQGTTDVSDDILVLQDTEEKQVSINKERFEKIVETYEEIKLAKMADLLNIDERDLELWILDNPSDFGISIKQDLVLFDKNKVEDAIDELFMTIEKAEATKEGKI